MLLHSCTHIVRRRSDDETHSLMILRNGSTLVIYILVCSLAFSSSPLVRSTFRLLRLSLVLHSRPPSLSLSLSTTTTTTAQWENNRKNRTYNHFARSLSLVHVIRSASLILFLSLHVVFISKVSFVFYLTQHRLREVKLFVRTSIRNYLSFSLSFFVLSSR